eukprot:gnl/MRDRNA2_/MRDRNA2_77089_c0_seq1.p1 gnl/MRDRNA2_/MRDRNA2_77089_c0~~gnl/MRDRNA2_/MRDRNA2_77089_c0_seq1.p1  ORF type:complete len:331 (-),score=77.25 gnl/MRDRNA2_/MRDRNA2_77089_c0_seq1:3-995(-)
MVFSITILLQTALVVQALGMNNNGLVNRSHRSFRGEGADTLRQKLKMIDYQQRVVLNAVAASYGTGVHSSAVFEDAHVNVHAALQRMEHELMGTGRAASAAGWAAAAAESALAESTSRSYTGEQDRLAREAILEGDQAKDATIASRSAQSAIERWIKASNRESSVSLAECIEASKSWAEMALKRAEFAKQAAKDAEKYSKTAHEAALRAGYGNVLNKNKNKKEKGWEGPCQATNDAIANIARCAAEWAGCTAQWANQTATILVSENENTDLFTPHASVSKGIINARQVFGKAATMVLMGFFVGTGATFVVLRLHCGTSTTGEKPLLRMSR